MTTLNIDITEEEIDLFWKSNPPGPEYLEGRAEWLEIVLRRFLNNFIEEGRRINERSTK